MRPPKVINTPNNKKDEKVVEQKVSCQFCYHASVPDNYMVVCPFNKYKMGLTPRICDKYVADEMKINRGPVKPVPQNTYGNEDESEDQKLYNFINSKRWRKYLK